MSQASRTIGEKDEMLLAARTVLVSLSVCMVVKEQDRARWD